MNKVYIVWSIYDDKEMVSIHKTETGARQALLDYLVYNCNYTAEDWEDFVDQANLTNVDQLRRVILESDEFDEELYMAIEEVKLED